MKYTLLEMVQSVLSSMDSDEVSTINETTESRQVAEVVRTVYFDLMNRSLLPEQYVVTSLEEAAVTVLVMPTGYEDLRWVKYDGATLAESNAGETNYITLTFLPVKEFMNRSDRLGISIDTDDTIEERTFNNALDADEEPSNQEMTYYVTNNFAPRYYTISRDKYIVLDSYDKAVDVSGVQSEKTKAYMRLVDNFSMEDTFQPTMDDPQFQLWLNEAKSLAWMELKQSPHSKAEQSAKRGWSQIQKSKHRIKGCSDFDELPNFGRKGYNYYG